MSIAYRMNINSIDIIDQESQELKQTLKVFACE